MRTVFALVFFSFSFFFTPFYILQVPRCFYISYGINVSFLRIFQANYFFPFYIYIYIYIHTYTSITSSWVVAFGEKRKRERKTACFFLFQFLIKYNHRTCCFAACSVPRSSVLWKKREKEERKGEKNFPGNFFRRRRRIKAYRASQREFR